MSATTMRTAAAFLTAGALAWAAAPAAALAPAPDQHPPRAAAATAQGAAAAQGAVALGGAALAQQQQLAQAAQSWQQQLANLAAAARRQGDGGLLIVITQVNGELQSVALFPPTVAGFLAALQASQNALTLWRNQPAPAAAATQPEWQEADRGASDLTTAEETGFVFAADLTSGTAWSYVNDPGPGAPDSDPDSTAPDAPDAANAPHGTAAVDAEIGAPEAPGQAAAPAGEGPLDLPEEPLVAGAAGDPAHGVFAGDPGQPDSAGRDSFVPGAEGTPGAPGPGWIVVHGGPSSGWPDETAPAGADPAFTLQLGEMDDSSPLDGSFALSDPADDSAASSAAAFDDIDAGAEPPGAAAAFPAGAQVCRPWQPQPALAAACALRPPLLDRF